jgi:diacylglycerol kinase family enzyme
LGFEIWILDFVYLYIYDTFVQDKKFEKELQKVENRLTDLGIAGKIVRLGLFRRADEFIRDEIRRGGATTVVAVGNDNTLRQIVDVVAEVGVVLGIIPLGTGNRLAEIFGVSEGEAACDILSARIVEKIDAGVINNRRFIGEVVIPAAKTEISCEDVYKVVPQGSGTISIRNLYVSDKAADVASNPTDGCLDVVVEVDTRVSGWSFRRRVGGQSILPLKNFSIRAAESVTILIDGAKSEGTRFEFSVEPGAIKIITGKGRRF